jgi:parvulin-like peptidyl-prolyl isomerase
MAMVQDIVIRQAAAAEGLVLDSANVEVQISQARAEAGEEGNAWAERLRQWGLSSEDEYRDRLEVRDLAAQLRNLKTPPVAPAEDELRAYVEANAARYAGRRSSRILLLRTVGMSEEDLLAHALNIRDQLRWGADLGTVAAEYTRTTNGSTMNGDMGWDAMNSSSPEYQAALNGLWPGEVSEPVVSEAGVTIIKCTDIYVLPEDGMVVYEWVPEGLRQMLSDQMAVQMQENSYRSYIDGLIRNAVVVIEPMPAGLPYAE